MIEDKIRGRDKSQENKQEKQKKEFKSQKKRKQNPCKSKKRKPTYRGGGKSNYIPIQYRHKKEKCSAFSSPSKHQQHAGAIDHVDLPYGHFITDREFQNDVSKSLTTGYVSRCSKEFIMGGGDRIDTIRQEVDNLLHNKKKLEVFGHEDDKVEYLVQQKDLLYGMKTMPNGTISPNSKKGTKIRFYEGYNTQEFSSKIEPIQSFEFGIQSMKQTIDEYEKRRKLENNLNRNLKTTYLDMSPKKFNYPDLRLQIRQLDLDLERQIRQKMDDKF